MPTISLCMIVKNEEAVLARCLDCVKELVDEIVLVDTGSTDATREIGAQYTDRIVQWQWIDDFAAARNYAFSLATMDYIMWLDADDVLLPDDQQRLRKLKEELPPHIDSVMMEYHLAFDTQGRPLAGTRRNRLVKRARGYKWKRPIHEYLDVSGEVLLSDIAVRHQPTGEAHSSRNLRIFEEMKRKGTSWTLRDSFYYANELTDQQRYEEAIPYYETFLVSHEGCTEDHLMACVKLSRCFKEIGRPDKSLEPLLLTMKYDVPRADLCCAIALHFQENKRYREAIYWLEAALGLERPSNHFGLMHLAAWTWLPHMQLAICYAAIGELQKAYAHNEQALSHLPGDENLIGNRRKLEEALARTGTMAAGGA